MDTMDELNDLQEKTGLYILKHNSKKNVAEAERLQNEFMLQKEVIGNIIERLKICDDSLNGKDPDTLIADDQLLKCNTLNKDMDEFQNVYNLLKGTIRQKNKV